MHAAARTTLITLATCLTMAGCSTPTPQVSRDEWLAMTTKTVKADLNTALKSAERVVILADESDTTISHNTSGFSAVRKATTWLVLAAVEDYWQWRVTAEPVQDGTRLNAEVFRTSNSITAMPVGPFSVPMTSNGTPGVPVTDPKLYSLLWSRIDHLLDSSTPWLTCEQAGVPRASPEADATALCGIGREDKKP